MKAQPDCIVCMFRQALNTIREVSNDPAVHMDIIRKLGARVAGLSLDQTPAGLSKPVYELIRQVTGEKDPYRKQKAICNRAALDMLPALRKIIAASSDPLDTALHIAVAGNIIDLGIGHSFDIEKDVMSIMQQPFAINDVSDFRKEIRPGAKLLYVGDNAGEIVFDSLLVNDLLSRGVDITFSVKSGPIINDATLADARQTGLTDKVKVIETGGDDIGVNWNHVSDEFRRTFEAADFLIAKGHGNFETCDERPQNIYFLLKVKCQMVANELDVALGSIVFKRSRRRG